ncbi:MAG: hypothetical protein GY701_16210 [Sulfitobacter sp.]|nr:hypothetical protein [Sulfitobacter sp.]
MGRRHGGWPERVPRPKEAKLSREEQQRLQARAMKFVGKSLILSEIVEEVQLARDWEDWG